MKHPIKLICLITALFLSSCATLFNTTRTSVYLRKPRTLKIDSVPGALFYNKNRFIATRSGDTITAYLSVDSLRIKLPIAPKKSFVYWENLLNLGLGFLIDKRTTKRYSYPRTLYVDEDEGVYKSSRSPLIKRGTFSVVPGFPYINFFHLRTDVGKLSSFGFMGVSLGLEYAVKTNRYLSLSGGLATDFPVPFPAPFDHFGEYHRNDIQYLSLRYHRRQGRMDFGCGFNFSNAYYFGYVRNEDSLLVRHSQENIGAGLSLALRYFIFQPIDIGIIYQPSFIGFHPSKFGYQHFISLELTFRLRCFRAGIRKKEKPRP